MVDRKHQRATEIIAAIFAKQEEYKQAEAWLDYSKHPDLQWNHTDLDIAYDMLAEEIRVADGRRRTN